MFDKDKTSELAINYRGSLSPKDPDFPAWWDKLKSEWEEPKRRPGGQEPSDD